MRVCVCVCDSCTVSCELQGEGQIVMRQDSTLMRLKKMVRRGGGGGGGGGERSEEKQFS